jgi:preprotein translocase subunit YajC
MGLIIVLSILSAGLLGLIVYFFFSKKSSRALKRAALAALIVIGLSLGVCGFFIVRGPGVSDDAVYTLPVAVTEETPVKDTNIPGLLVFMVLLLALLGVIIFIGMRDQKKKAVDKAVANVKDEDLEGF